MPLAQIRFTGKFMDIHITVNGNTYQVNVGPGEMLVEVLRQRLQLTGTKVGCNEAECGSCTVLIENKPVLACAYPAARADGKSILTIEGLAGLKVKRSPSELEKLHPLQQAFVLYGAVQCGFCIPGQIMAAYGLLQRNPDPTKVEIRQSLKDTLCRCGVIHPSNERSLRQLGLCAKENRLILRNGLIQQILNISLVQPYSDPMQLKR